MTNENDTNDTDDGGSNSDSSGKDIIRHEREGPTVWEAIDTLHERLKNAQLDIMALKEGAKIRKENNEDLEKRVEALSRKVDHLADQLDEEEEQ